MLTWYLLSSLLGQLCNVPLIIILSFSGTISVFLMAEDFNSMTLVRDILAHRDRVTDLVFSLNCEMILSV